jgi:hypothetical protein
MTLLRRVAVEKRLLVLPLGVALALNAVFYAVAVYPLSWKVNGADARAAVAAAALRDAQAEHDAATGTLVGKKRADEELRRFYRDVLPASERGARDVTYLPLNQLASGAGLRMQRGGLERKIARDSPLGQLRGTLVLTGDYADIRKFIHDLETGAAFLILESVGLVQGESRDAPLQLTLDVATYYWAGDHGR